MFFSTMYLKKYFSTLFFLTYEILFFDSSDFVEKLYLTCISYRMPFFFNSENSICFAIICLKCLFFF